MTTQVINPNNEYPGVNNSNAILSNSSITVKTPGNTYQHYDPLNSNQSTGFITALDSVLNNRLTNPYINLNDYVATPNNLLWDDLRVSLTASAAGIGNSPTRTVFLGNIQAWSFRGDDGPEEQLFFDIQLPHTWASGTDVHPHLHWTRGLTGIVDNYGILNLNAAPGQTVNFAGAYVKYHTGVYTNNSNVVVTGLLANSGYAAYYSASKNYTLLMKSNAPANAATTYIFYSGDWRSGQKTPVTSFTLSTNAGTQYLGSYYPTTGTFNTKYVLGPYLPIGGTGYIKWGLEYTWANIGEGFQPSTTIYQTDVVPEVNNYHSLCFLPNISGDTKKLSSILMCRLFRDSSDGEDTFTGNAYALSFDLHIANDKDGGLTPTAGAV